MKDQILHSCNGAMMRHPSFGFIFGWGDCCSYEEQPEGATAFYINDFMLSEAKPWKVFSELEIIPEWEPEPLPPMDINWEPPSPDSFVQVFEEICEEIQQGRMKKVVPALGQLGKLSAAHSPRELIARAMDAPDYLYPYAHWQGEKGFCGASPEFLFKEAQGRLCTMALAGTARPEDEHVFLSDAKEIHEHEIVARELLARLAPHGNLHREAREVRRFGSIIHFFSELSLEPEVIHSPDFWVHLLHPTPALGTQPRTDLALSKLYDWRERLRCPRYFGAPFGCSHQGEFVALVLIRGISWDQQKLLLTAGGGIVSSSSLTHEWREFALKRQAIRNHFQL